LKRAEAKNTVLPASLASIMVEAGGVEPPSENILLKTSTCVSELLNLTPATDNRPTVTSASPA